MIVLLVADVLLLRTTEKARYNKEAHVFEGFGGLLRESEFSGFIPEMK